MKRHSIAKIAARITDAVFLTRPVVVVPVWGFSVLGYVNAGGAKARGAVAAYTMLVDFGWMVVFSAAVGMVYIVNQVADYRADARNPGFALLVHGGVSKRIAIAAAAGCAVVSLAVPVVAGRAWLAAFSAAAILTGILYSVRPFYFTGRVFLDFLTNAFGFGVIAYGAGWYCAGGISSVMTDTFVRSAVGYVLLMCAGSISSTIPDRRGDADAGKITTAVALGQTRAHILALVLLAAAGGYGLYTDDPIVAVTAAAALPLYVAYLFVARARLMEATYKIGGVVLMGAAGILFPFFLVCAAVVVAATRVYFHLRHRIVYPALLPACTARK
jgi:4-hydroxybenzoate polyprenyltransferase